MDREVADRKVILYEHYRKEVATKATILARSATPNSQKIKILPQEVLTIMTHCSPHLSTDVRNKHINEVMKRIQFSGYSKEFRFDVYHSAVKA